MNLKSSRDIVDKKILTQDGREVGYVEAIDVDLETWKVQSMELKLRRDALEALHIKRPLFGTRSARLSVEHVSGVTDSVVLKTGMEELSAKLSDVEHEES
jgi:sporulation protein YlmC with PRC-barrel domain